MIPNQKNPIETLIDLKTEYDVLHAPPEIKVTLYRAIDQAIECFKKIDELNKRSN